jgi:hypothetical protein
VVEVVHRAFRSAPVGNAADKYDGARKSIL